jgi:hypothetical protein
MNLLTYQTEMAKGLKLITHAAEGANSYRGELRTEAAKQEIKLKEEMIETAQELKALAEKLKNTAYYM